MRAPLVSICVGLFLSGCGPVAPAEPTLVAPSEHGAGQAREPAEASVVPVLGQPFAPEPVDDARQNAIATEFAESGALRVIGRLPGGDDAVLASIIRPRGVFDSGCPDCDEHASDCTRTHVIRIVGDGTAASPLRIDGELRAVCPAADLSNVEIADFDGDAEMELRFVSRIPLMTLGMSRTGPGVSAGVAVRAVYATMELRPQAEFMLSERYEQTGESEPNERSEASVRYEDVNEDGFIDLVVDRFYASHDCEADDITQLTPEADPACAPHAVHGVHYYRQTADAWSEFAELESPPLESIEVVPPS